MQHTNIDRTASQLHALSLFDVHHDNRTLCGAKLGPRQAVDAEIYAYAEWLAFKAGLMPRAVREIIGGEWSRSSGRGVVKGITYGEVIANGTISTPKQYEAGAYSVPFPGRNAHRDRVTFETLNDAGEIIASSCLPVEPRKGGIAWDKAAVRAAAGPVAKVRKGKAAAMSTPPSTPPAVGMMNGHEIEAVEPQAEPKACEAPHCAAAVAISPEIALAAIPATGGLAGQVEALAATVAALQMMVQSLIGNRSSTPGDAIPPLSWESDAISDGTRNKRVRSDAEIRLLRRISAIRRDNANLRNEVTEQAYDLEQGRLERSPKHIRAIMAVAALRNERAALRQQIKFERHAYDCEADALRAARREIARLKLTPAYMGHDGRERPDVIAISSHRANDARDRADKLERELATARAVNAEMEKRGDAMANELMAATGRALRAENALRAIEARRDRAGTPYQVKPAAVSFGIAA